MYRNTRFCCSVSEEARALHAPECFFRMEPVHVATRILATRGGFFMATYHHSPLHRPHRSEFDEASALPINGADLPQAVSPCNLSALRAALRATIARFTALPYFGRASLNKRALPNSSKSYGANGRTRTADLLFTKQLLCRLSYVGSPIQFTMIGVGLPHDFPLTLALSRGES